MIKTLLVPVDGSEHSSKALGFACELAKRFSADLHVLHVVDIVLEGQTMVLGASSVNIPMEKSLADEIGESITGKAASVAEEQGCTPAGVSHTTGRAAQEILAAAEAIDADTIVMGSRGLSDLGGLLMGSVSHKVGHLAKCTCITVR